jgi:hypothetical protein
VIAAAAGVDPATITHEDAGLPFPERVESSSLAELVDLPPQMSFGEGVERSVADFRTLLAAGAIDAPG